MGIQFRCGLGSHAVHRSPDRQVHHRTTLHLASCTRGEDKVSTELGVLAACVDAPTLTSGYGWADNKFSIPRAPRSEERRVGKESRAGWSACQKRKAHWTD